MSTRVTGASLALALAILTTACGIRSDSGATAGPSITASNGGNEGGFGAPSQMTGEFVGFSTSSATAGTLRLADNGCWYADLNGTERLAVFPIGFELSRDDAAELVDGDGNLYRAGDRFDATAAMVPVADAPGGADGKWGSYLSFCQPEVPELALFDTLVKEFEPDALTDEALGRMVTEAAFTEHWPCGRGWAVSTADQRVAVTIYAATDDSSGTTNRIELPDPNWTAEVLIGKNLFAQQCNDAIDQWVAVPTIVRQWTLTAGAVRIHDLLPDPSSPPTAVSAILEGGTVETPSGDIALPTLDLHNKDFNFFAG